jgi:MFS family permease
MGASQTGRFVVQDNGRPGWLGFTRYQWLVLFAAWLGWGFDVFDGLLFNYVAPLCVPDLLGIPLSDPRAAQEASYWTGILTSLLLLGWALGGVVFGKITDKLGRTRTLLFTMLTYAIATAACAFAPNMYVLVLFRFIASLGIGGEWAAGASLVAETVPENKRTLAGALLYTSAPMGLLLAGFISKLFTKTLDVFAQDPSLAWRAVFLTGLVPAFVAFIIRLKVKEPEKWQSIESQAEPKIRELFEGKILRKTLGGLSMSIPALIVWWSCNAFISVIFGFLSQGDSSLKVEYVTYATYFFCFGGIVGTLLTIPIADRLGRRAMFFAYFLLSSVAVWVTFGNLFDLAPWTRVYLMAFIGLTTFGVFGSFTFYFPELFPTRLRGTGSGFCYNTGRVITAFFPFGIGYVVRSGVNPMDVIKWVAIIPLIGLIFIVTGVVEETKDAKMD